MNLPITIMKQLNYILASPLAELINKWFQSGISPDIFKIAEVIPIIPMNHECSAITIDQYVCSQTLAN